MTVLDRVRIERAVQSYSWWLELRGAPGRRRRELRRELRANLTEAAADQGARRAVRALGSTRQMAAEAAPVDPTRPRWTVGAQAALVAVTLTVVIEVLAGLAWMDGVMAADQTRPTTGSLTLFPGSSLSFTPEASGFSMAFALGWTALVVGVLAFAVAARPWRSLSRRAAVRGQDTDRTLLNG